MKKVIIIVGLLVFLASPLVMAEEEIILNEEEAVELAIENNRQIQEAKKDIEIARQELKQARAGYFPSLDLSGSYTRMGDLADDEDDEINTGDPQLDAGFEAMLENMEPPENNFSLQFDLEQLIYSGGARSAGYEMAQNQLEIAEKELEQEKEELAHQIREQYYGILQAEEMVALLESSLARVEEYLKQAETNYELGLFTQTDVLQAEISKNQLQQEILSAENGLKLAEMSFRNSLSLDDEMELELSSDLDYEVEEIDYEKALAKAENNRFDLAMLDIQGENMELLMQQANSSRLPQVFFRGSYGTEAEEIADSFRLDEASWNATIGINYNLFDGGSSSAEREVARQEKEKFELMKEETLDMVALDVKEKVLKLDELEQQIELQKLNKSEAEKNLKENELKYEQGMITSLELLEAQDTFQEAKINYYQGIYDYNLALSDYKKAIGIGL